MTALNPSLMTGWSSTTSIPNRSLVSFKSHLFSVTGAENKGVGRIPTFSLAL